MDGWPIWNILGLCPVVTQPVYLISMPWFSSITMDIGDGKTINITATGLDDSSGSYYVQSLSVNGQPWTKLVKSHGSHVR
jgi:putative alpha-1,2-mannosidase